MRYIRKIMTRLSTLSRSNDSLRAF